jgi:predicted small secreted protein
MRKTFCLTLTFLMLIGAVPLLGACHTTAGFGEDVSNGGQAITHDANKAMP